MPVKCLKGRNAEVINKRSKRSDIHHIHVESMNKIEKWFVLQSTNPIPNNIHLTDMVLVPY